MPTAKPKTLSLELVPPATWSTQLNAPEHRVERIVAYHNGTRRSAAQQIVYAFLAGAELLAQKEQLAHGLFMKWCKENLPEEISHATACRYMSVAEALQTKFLTVRNLDLPTLQITNGELKETEIESVSEAIREVITAKNITELYRDLGLVKKPIPQSERAPGPKMSPEEAEELRRANAKQFCVTLAGDLETFSTDHGELHAALDVPDLDDLHRAILTASRLCRDLLKSRRKSKSKQKATKATKKETMSPEQRAEIAKSARARWARLKAKEGK